MVGGRRVGQGGPGSRPSVGRVDDARSARDRRPGRRHRPLPLPSAHPLPCAGAHLGGLQQDLRHRPPCRAVELRSQHPPLPHARAGEGTVSSVLRSRRLGATAVVRIEREPARGVRRRRDGPQRRVGVPLVVADHQRRTPGPAQARRPRRPVELRHLRRLRARRPRGGPAHRPGTDGCDHRPRRLHPDPR